MRKTNVASGNKWIWDQYPSDGLYENTDEIGTVEIIYRIGGVIWVLPIELKECLKDEEVKELEEKQEGMITENFALKMLAIVRNGADIKEIDLKL